MPAVRVGLAGFGLAGRVFHAPLIEATDGLRLAAVVTSRRDEVARAHPHADVVSSVDELWGRCDVVVVATPNRTHVPIAREAVRHGLPVVVDKPLAVNAAAGEELVRDADRRGVPLTVFQNRRLDGDFLTVRTLLRDGTLGEVIRFDSRFERFRPVVDPAVWREQGAAAEGGGVLLDLGPHLVDQALQLFGPAECVYGEVEARRDGAQADDDAFVALTHASGVRSHLWMSAVAPLHGPRFAVSGLAAGLAIDGLDVQEPQLRDGMQPGDPAFGMSDQPARLVDADGERPVPVERGDYVAFYRGVVDWLAADRPPPVEPSDAVAALRVLDAARRSSHDRRVVELGESQR
ncbi:MAG: Gfo/Idh/MocA family oxidoreductase [Thermoleophilaceae bacterium]